MNGNRNTRSMNEMIDAIRGLDLGPIKYKLMDRDEGEGWTREFAERMELEYKRFLTLRAKYPQEPLAPGKDVDRFWHAHILDTQKYVEDCERVFGHYLHHFPYFGMRGAEDAAAWAVAGERTRALYAAEFQASADAHSAAWCSVAGETKAAWCSVAGESKAAWCSVAGEAKAAWCSVGGPRLDTDTRPSLARIA
jgi:hypothetical protein